MDLSGILAEFFPVLLQARNLLTQLGGSGPLLRDFAFSRAQLSSQPLRASTFKEGERAHRQHNNDGNKRRRFGHAQSLSAGISLAKRSRYGSVLTYAPQAACKRLFAL